MSNYVYNAKTYLSFTCPYCRSMNVQIPVRWVLKENLIGIIAFCTCVGCDEDVGSVIG